MTPENQAKWDKLEVAKQRAIEVRDDAIQLQHKLGFRSKGRKARQEAELWIATALIAQKALEDA